MNDSKPPDSSSWRAWAAVMLAAAILSGPLIPKLLDRADQMRAQKNADAANPVSQRSGGGGVPGGVAAGAGVESGGTAASFVSPAPVTPPPPPPPLLAPAPVAAENELPVQMIQLLTPADLAGKSRWELDVMRNEIYARHHRRFNRPDLQRYFDAQAWYQGLYAPEEFSDDMLTPVERANTNFIREYEGG